MTWAPTEVQKTIYETLSGDVVLTTLIGANKIFDHVPDNTTFPFVVININPWEDRGSHTTEGFTATIMVDTYYREPSRGKLPVHNIQSRIDELIHKEELCFMGWNIISLRRDFFDIITEDDNVTLHGIQRFKLMLGEV